MAARRINLLPPELAKKRRSRQVSSMLGAAGLALIALFALVYVVQQIRVGGERARLEAAEDRNAELRQEVAELNEFDELEEELDRKTELLSDLTRNEVRWSVLLADISLVIPSDVWLTSLNGNVNAGSAEDDADGGSDDDETAAPSLGQIQMSGVTFSHPDVARWLTRLGNIEAFASPYLSLSAKATIGTSPVVNFNSTVELSERAFRRTQRQAERPL